MALQDVSSKYPVITQNTLTERKGIETTILCLIFFVVVVEFPVKTTLKHRSALIIHTFTCWKLKPETTRFPGNQTNNLGVACFFFSFALLLYFLLKQNLPKCFNYQSLHNFTHLHIGN